MNNNLRLLLLVGIFAASMAFLESAVVVYLRALYYPEGFAFPLKMMDPRILVTEIIREVATMVMLVSIGVIAVKGWLKRFAVFIFAFAVWDIFYYVYLYLLLGWPSSFFTWDLLFLLPVTWVGPVLAPVINSLTMILLSVIILHYKSKDDTFRMNFHEWLLLITGSLIVIYVYTRPYMAYMLARYSFAEIISLNGDNKFPGYAMAFVPSSFNWVIYSLGQLLFFKAIFLVIRKQRHP